MVVSYIGLGSNLGNREKNINLAIEKIKRLKNTKLTKISTIIETNPVGGPPQGRFLNAAVEIKTDLSPWELLSSLQSIEKALGRERTVKNGPRTIDLDILLYNNRNIIEKNLIIPHPRIKERDFVLIPLKEIAGQVVHKIIDEDYKKN